MKTSNIIIFLIVVIVIAGIFGFAIWDMRNTTEGVDTNNVSNNIKQEEVINTNTTDDLVNTTQDGINTNTTEQNNNNNDIMQNLGMYEGEWYISQDAYINAERIDELMDRRDDRFITDEEFENELQTLNNDEVAELDVDEYYGDRIKFDFELTGPAPTQRVARLEDIVVELANSVGTFTYTDNWGTSGNGTITLKDNQIELKLETTKVNQGTLWGVEGAYTFSYKLSD